MKNEQKSEKNFIKRFLCGFVPRRVSNRAVLRFFEFLRRQQRLFKRDFSEKTAANERAFGFHQEEIAKNGGYIEDQHRWKDVRYGRTNMRRSGCEIFAAFNAIRGVLGRDIMPLHEMIAAFEKDGMVLGGRFGTAPKAVSDFLEKQGFFVKMSHSEAEFDALGEESDGLILTLYNDRSDIMKQVHSVSISKENGLYTAHNAGGNGRSTGPYASVSEVIGNINGGRAKGISLIGIKRENKDKGEAL